MRRPAASTFIEEQQSDEGVAGLVARLVERIEEQDALIRALADRVDHLERRAAPREIEDVKLLVALARSTAGAAFRTPWLIQHARVDAGLANALRDATVQSSRELGCVLRRLRGRHDDIVVERLHDQRWRVLYITT